MPRRPGFGRSSLTASLSHMPTPTFARAGRVARGVALATILAALGPAACSDSGLLDVGAPDVITPDGLESRAGALALRAGALNAFAAVFASEFGQVTVSGSVADEFAPAHQLVLRTANSRAMSGVADDNGMFQKLQHARLAAAEAEAALLRFPPAGDVGTAVARAQAGEVRALAGFTKLFLAEGYCAGVPLSHGLDGRAQYGVPLTTAQLLDSAVADFDAAAALAGDSTRVVHLAHLGRARALLALDRPAEAAQAASAVPSSYVYLVEYSAGNTRQTNGVPGLVRTLRHATVADREGGNGLPFVTAADPRVVTELVGIGFDQVTPVYAPAKYATPGSPAVLASGVDARLIQAEAALRAGESDAWLDGLNALRAGVPGLAPLTDPGAGDARVDLHFRERAFWQFGTGQRLGDLRRLVRQYGRAAESVFPTGEYPGGGAYGSDVNIPIPESERANPNFTGCLDRNA